jgi:iron complex outermembrane receptor protein
VRPATLRGLGPDQVLVLVNGKRRHQSALVREQQHRPRLDWRGSQCDPAVGHRSSILRRRRGSGGSDAIAGVINIVLKGGVMRPEVTSNAGHRRAPLSATAARPTVKAACLAATSTSPTADCSTWAGRGVATGKGSVTIASDGANRTNRASFDPATGHRGDAGHNASRSRTIAGAIPIRDTMTFVNSTCR